MATNESIRKAHTHTHAVDTVNMEMVSVQCAQIASHVFSEMDKYSIRGRALALWHKDRDMEIRSNIDPLMTTTTTTSQKTKRQQQSFVYTIA